MDSYRASRQYERLVFDGVPEHPETTYQRSTYSIVDERITGRGLFSENPDLPEEEYSQVIATILYNLDRGEVRVKLGDEEFDV